MVLGGVVESSLGFRVCVSVTQVVPVLKSLDALFRARRSPFQEASMRALCCLLRDYKYSQ